MVDKYVYFFGGDQTEGKAEMKNLLGGKGANLAEMAGLGINVPPGFTISTEACVYYFKNDKTFPPNLWDEIVPDLKRVETLVGKKFGDGPNPLLLSVRSGARVSMPGMMDTVLNLGLNDATARGLADKTQNERFAFDCYRRFAAMFGDVVLGVPSEKFESILTAAKSARKVEADTDLSAADLQSVLQKFKSAVRKHAGTEFPDDPMQQLRMAVEAVFNSWNTPRAITYRKLNHYPDDWGTAVNVQAMVFGNLGNDSATGVAFTRNPATGEKSFYGEYMINAQGEDVVAGIRTPSPIAQLEKEMPEVYRSLEEVYKKLETHYRDMQDLEFTIQEKQLYLLQTRGGKRTASAAIRIAVDMVKEGLIDKNMALTRVPAVQMDQIFHPTIDPKAKYKAVAKGLGASPGAASGKVVFTPEHAQKLAEKKEKVILVRMETSPEDIHGMNVAQGILTAKGGMTSHAAVVARGMGKPCVSGCSSLNIDEKKKLCSLNGAKIKEYDYITLDGSTGQVILGQAPLVQPKLTGYFSQLMTWADEVRRLSVRANADTPHDALVARDFGAQGIGLCRTEHMFFNEERILLVRQMIVSENAKEREEPLRKLLPIQRQDFTEIFRVMEGLPVTIRLLDPPLHEFLPKTQTDIRNLAREMRASPANMYRKIQSLHEINPMLGHRGCRLGITYPEIYRMQTRAIMEAACKLAKKGMKILPEIMIPLVGHVAELRVLRELVVQAAEEALHKSGVALPYKIGTMIELPRAAMTADEIAKEADFFSFGTNDLTQTVYGLSRDDSGSFLPDYLQKGIWKVDPFASLDQKGVGQLIELAINKARGAGADLHYGICGEHGGDPASILFFNKIGVNYVSCSPYRVPTALLAAAQAAIQQA
ncbi:MAG: pyruvate, phosphate dikinase [Nitrospinae bacterium]|nr:pyruvate, phosphate dikinase [Nitrospinota bacterium]